MKATAKTPEGRLRQFCVLRARRHGHDAQWVRERAGELFGIPPAEGFCLTALSKPQLIQLADHVVQMTGGTPGQHRPGPRRPAPGARRDPMGVVLRLASRAQRDLIESLARSVFGGPFGPGSAFSAFLVGMTGKSETRLLAGNQAGKVIEALQAMSRRGWKPRAASRESRAATGGSDGAAG